MAFNTPDPAHVSRDLDAHADAAKAAEARGDWWDAVHNWSEALASVSQTAGKLVDGQRKYLRASLDRAKAISRGSPVSTPPTLEVHQDPSDPLPPAA